MRTPIPSPRMLLALPLAGCLLGRGPNEIEREANRLAELLVAGEIKLADGEPDLTIACFDRVIEESDYVEAYVARGQAYREKGERDRALDDLSTALQKQPGHVMALYRRGLLYIDLRDFAAALGDFDHALETLVRERDEMTPKDKLSVPKESWCLHNRGHAYFGLGEFERAIGDYDAAIAKGYESSQAYASRATAFTKLGNYDQATADVGTALRLDPNCPDAQHAMGEIHVQRKEFEDAIVRFQRALDLPPQDAAADNALSVVSRQMRAAGTHNSLGVVFGQTGDDDRAFESYTKAMELDPTYALYPINRGSVYFGRGEYEQAIRDFDVATSIDPREYSAYLMRGRALERLGRQEEAQRDYDQALSLNPSWSEPPLTTRRDDE